MRTHLILLIALLLLFAPQVSAKVTGENTDQLPPGCDEIRGHEELTVHGGQHYAHEFPGTMFTYDDRTYNFKPCTRVTVTFVNNDSVRHQWMVHGLPASIHEMGMFNIEVTGPGKDTGTFITPSEPKTLMVHCGVPQHEQKGMKAQVKVGGGTGNLAGIPGLTGKVNEFNYPRESHVPLSTLMLVVGLMFGAFVAYTGPHRKAQAWLKERHDIHITVGGRYGLQIRTGEHEVDEQKKEKEAETEEVGEDSDEEPAEEAEQESGDSSEPSEPGEETPEDEDEASDDASGPASGTSEPGEKKPVEPQTPETDSGGDSGDDGWLEKDDGPEVGDW